MATAVGWTWSWRPPTTTVASPLWSFPLSLPLQRFRVVHERKTRPFKVCCDYSCFEIKDVSYRPPGTKFNLLDGVSFSLREKSFGLIFGRSGSGKTTLLQLIAGFSKPTSGSLHVQTYGNDGCPNNSPELLDANKVGIVFQFPERYFVAETVLDEVIFGWPRQKGGSQLKELLALRLQKAITSVDLTGIALDQDPQSLSGGYKRRLALAIQYKLQICYYWMSLLLVLRAVMPSGSIMEDGDGWNTQKRVASSLIDAMCLCLLEQCKM